jgi:TolB-like protein/DNA-binding SARP family transcriptional activator
VLLQEQAMAEFRLTLLGAFGVSASAPCEVPSKKGQALLALLAIPLGRPHRRDKLAAMLWSGLPEDAARQNLRQCLTALRKGCQAGESLPVVAKDGSLRLDEARVLVDVCEFEEAVRRRDPAALARASAIYRGELLEGLNLEEGPFEEWLIGERQRLHTMAVESFGRLLTHHEQSGDREQATHLATRLLAIDPLLEHVHRALMRLHHQGGNTAQALKQYVICEKILRRELAIEPEAATKELRKTILQTRRSPSSWSGSGGSEARLFDDQPSLPGGSEVPSRADEPECIIEQPSSASSAATPSVLDRPRLSIVVLPFANIGGNPAQEHFVDGMTESLTTDLSRMSGMRVIGCNTAFTYKGKHVDLKQIGHELGVRYVLEGSVQRSGDRMRVNAHLVDTEAATQLWAERFDMRVADLLDMQDGIAARLARQLVTHLNTAEARRAEQTPNPDSLDLYFQGVTWVAKGSTAEYLSRARSYFERALTIDPGNIQALVMMANVDLVGASAFATSERTTQLAATEAALTKILSTAPEHAFAHTCLGWLHILTNRAIQGIADCERALILTRNLGSAHALIGLAKISIGRSEETEAHVQEALRLSPRDTYAYTWLSIAGFAKLLLGRDEEAVTRYRRSIEINRNHPLAHFNLAAALAHFDRLDEARSAVQEGLALNPTFTLCQHRLGQLSDNPTYLAQHERVVEGLRKAGVPEG